MPLTHIDEHGNARMVDVGEKPPTSRVAVAEGFIRVGPSAWDLLAHRSAPKGDVLAVAQLAGIQGTKRTSDLIPLCHPLAISGVDVHLELLPGQVRCVATVRTVGPTGVEMEALTAVSTALLTVYDMLKAVDRAMELGPIRLVEKSGGRSGRWVREGA